MSLMNKVMLSIFRNKGKSFLLITLVFLMSSLISASIVVRNATYNTDLLLRKRMPAIVSIRHDTDAAYLSQRNLFNETGKWVYFENISVDLIREIGYLPYVDIFDFNAVIHAFYSNYLMRYFNRELITSRLGNEVVTNDHQSLRTNFNMEFEHFTFKGVENPNVLDIEAGLIELVGGRTFTRDEVRNGTQVILVSQQFLNINSLNLGDFVSIDLRVFYPIFGSSTIHEFLSLDNLASEKSFEFEIIGIFDRCDEYIESFLDVNNHFSILNTIYTSNNFISFVNELMIEALYDVLKYFVTDTQTLTNHEDLLDYSGFIFLLNSPLEVELFRNATNEILPDYWIVSDLSNTYKHINNSMNMMNQIFNTIMIVAVFSMATGLTLLIILILRERRQEIGIYLALGAKKIEILKQVVIEILILGIIGTSLGLLMGYNFSSLIAREMLRIDMTNQAESQSMEFIFGGTPEGLGFHHRMSLEEQLYLFDPSLNATTIILFFVTSTSLLITATAISTLFIVKLEPKTTLILSNGS